MKLDIPNLDAMPANELREWAATVTKTSLVWYQAKMYATLKATAMDLRESGRISAALANEAECDAIYSRMSKRYRW